MFRFADIGRFWVPMTLPLGEEGVQPEVWLLLEVFTSKELTAREAAVVDRAGAQIKAEADKAGTTDDVHALIQRLAELEDSERLELLARTHDWRGVTAADGSEEPFAIDKLEALLAYRWWYAPHREALYAASREGVRKNFKPGPAGTPARVQA